MTQSLNSHLITKKLIHNSFVCDFILDTVLEAAQLHYDLGRLTSAVNFSKTENMPKVKHQKFIQLSKRYLNEYLDHLPNFLVDYSSLALVYQIELDLDLTPLEVERQTQNLEHHLLKRRYQTDRSYILQTIQAVRALEPLIFQDFEYGLVYPDIVDHLQQHLWILEGVSNSLNQVYTNWDTPSINAGSRYLLKKKG